MQHILTGSTLILLQFAVYLNDETMPFDKPLKENLNMKKGV